MNELTNPYLHADEDLPDGHPDKGVRIVSVVTQSAYQRLRSIGLPKGYIQCAINQFWSKLTNELDKRNIRTYLDSDRFNEFITNMQLSYPGGVGEDGPGSAEASTASSTGRGTPGPDSTQPGKPNGRRAKGKSGRDSSTTNVKSDVPRSDGEGGESNEGSQGPESKVA